MRFVCIDVDGVGPTVAIRDHDGVVVVPGFDSLRTLIAAGDAGLSAARDAVAHGTRVQPEQLLAPLYPGKILCAGVNYVSHIDENPAATIPEEPFFFAKLPSAVIGPGAPIVIPPWSTQVDYEVELAMVIGRRVKDLSRDDALDAVFGWTVINDVSARDVQFKDAQITLGKNGDTFCPLGPEVVTSAEFGDWSKAYVSSTLNGAEVQSSPTDAMIFSPEVLLAYLSARMTLEPGDVVTTGTPAGVGLFRRPQLFLRSGDVITVAVRGIGELTNPVIGR